MVHQRSLERGLFTRCDSLGFGLDGLRSPGQVYCAGGDHGLLYVDIDIDIDMERECVYDYIFYIPICSRETLLTCRQCSKVISIERERERERRSGIRQAMI